MELEANNKRELENELYSKEFREKEGKEETQMTTKTKKGQLHSLFKRIGIVTSLSEIIRLAFFARYYFSTFFRN